MYNLRKREKVFWRNAHARRAQTLSGTHWIFGEHRSRKAEVSTVCTGSVPGTWKVPYFPYSWTMLWVPGLLITSDMMHMVLTFSSCLCSLRMVEFSTYFLFSPLSLNSPFSYLSPPNFSYACSFCEKQTTYGTEICFYI